MIIWDSISISTFRHLSGDAEPCPSQCSNCPSESSLFQGISCHTICLCIIWLLTIMKNSSRRRKCHTPEFGSSCTYCTDRGIQCTRSTLPARLRPPDPPKQLAPAVEDIQPAPPQTSVQLPPVPVCVELTHLYFDLIHDQFHSLFHRPSVIQDVEQGRAPLVILFAIMALSAR